MKSYLRFLGRNKLYTAIEVVGLSVSLAFVVFTAVFAWDIYTKTWIYPEHKNIYAVNCLSPYCAHYDMSLHLDEIPEIKEHCEISSSTCRIVSGESRTGHRVYAVSEDFLKMFPKKLITGNWELLNNSGYAVITRSLAKSLFGNINDAIGNTFDVLLAKQSNFNSLTVTGVIEDYTTEIFNTEILIGIDTPEGALLQKGGRGIGDQIFVKTEGQISQEELSDKLHDLIRRHLPEIEEFIIKMKLNDSYASRLDDLYRKHVKNGLRGGEMQGILIVMTLISLTLLLSAILNYINLSFAQTSKRSNALATMSLVGADRKKIIQDQITESLTLTTICTGLAIVIAWACAPLAREMMNLATLNISIGIGSVIMILMIIFIVGVIAGLAPALLATSYKPIEVTKGSFRKKRKMVFSKIFICIQNTLAAALLVIACCLMSDIHKRANEPMGFGSENIVFIDNIGDKFEDMLRVSPYVKSIGRTDKLIHGGMAEYMRNKVGNEISADLLICDTSAFRILGFKIKDNLHSDLHRSVWVTESLMESLGLTSEDIQTGNSGSIFMSPMWADTHFGGVIEDYKIAKISLSELPRIVLVDSRHPDMKYLAVETSGDRNEVKESIFAISRQYSLDNSATGFLWSDPGKMTLYLDEFREIAMFQQRRVMSIVRLFTIIAVLISILGMFGMSSYYANENTRSIAIHKIHGGTVKSETLRNVRTYMLLTAIAVILGSILGTYIIRTYLNEYTYMNLNYILPVAIAISATFVIAFASVLWQTLRAARTNPAEALKKE